MDQQTRLLGRLVRIISETAEYRRSQDGSQSMGLPATEGMTIVFFGDPVAPARCATEIARALHGYPEMKLRMGIHSGPVYRVAGIDARASVAGEGIKTAQRIMGSGDAGHILVSRTTADTLSQLGNWSKCLHDLGEREITPGTRLQLFNLYTGEAGNPECPGALAAMRPASAPAAAGTADVPAATKRTKPLFIIAASVIAIAVAIAGYLILNRGPSAEPLPLAKARPLMTGEFAETFVSLDQWNYPQSGWTILNKSLQIDGQRQLGYAREVYCKDFTMTFSLKLVNDVGAAWALRVQDPDNYYLFCLSGPGGQTPNTFLTYLVKDNKSVQKGAALSVLAHLVAGGQYTIEIEVKGNQISHTIKTDDTSKEFESELGVQQKLGFFQDLDDNFPAGGIGFRTLGGEKFIVSALFVRPPGVVLPE